MAKSRILNAGQHGGANKEFVVSILGCWLALRQLNGTSDRPTVEPTITIYGKCFACEVFKVAGLVD